MFKSTAKKTTTVLVFLEYHLLESKHGSNLINRHFRVCCQPEDRCMINIQIGQVSLDQVRFKELRFHLQFVASAFVRSLRNDICLTLQSVLLKQCGLHRGLSDGSILWGRCNLLTHLKPNNEHRYVDTFLCRQVVMSLSCEVVALLCACVNKLLGPHVNTLRCNLLTHLKPNNEHHYVDKQLCS